MPSSRTVIPSAAFLLVVVAVLLDHLGSAHGQNYHYSNGWHPGKRGDVEDFRQTAMYQALTTDHQCEIRQHILQIINHLITEEIARLGRGCSSQDNFDFLKTLMEPSRAAPARRRRGRGQREEDGGEEGGASVMQW